MCLGKGKLKSVLIQLPWPSDIVIIQNHSNLSYFEAILPLKQFCWKFGKEDQCDMRARRKRKKQNNEILHLFITSAILVNPMDVFSNICIDTWKIRVGTSNAKRYNSNNIHFGGSIESFLKQKLIPFKIICIFKVPTS